MASANKVILMGNMTADPELRQTQTGKFTCSFSIAVNRRFGKTTDFFNVDTWNQTAEFVAKYGKKGKQLLVIGELQNQSWTDANGQKKYKTVIVSEEVQFTSAPAKEDENNDPAYAPVSTPKFEEISSEEDLPF